jgi:anthranilate synthase component 1
MDDINKLNFIDTYNSEKPQIIQKELIADTETPISSLIKLSADEKYSFLLESVEGGDQRGRFSLLGCDPDIIWEVKDNEVKVKSLDKNLDLSFLSKKPIESLKQLINFSKINRDLSQPPFPTVVGYFGYPMIQFMEKINIQNHDEINIPDAIMIRPKLVAVFDNIKDTINIMTSVYPNKNMKAEEALKNSEEYIDQAINKLNKDIPLNLFNLAKNDKNINFKSNYTEKEYYSIIEKAKTYIKKGDVFQVVTSQRFTSDYNLNALALYRSLRRLNPSPFLVNLNFDTFSLVASSPEILVRLRDNKITIRPIAGTRKRGKNTNEDLELSRELLSDQKELAEHLMLLDLGRNDVGRVSKIGSVKVTEKMLIEYYSHVMHIVSNVEGEIDDNFDAVDALISGFPAGTVSGAPKIRAMEIIEELENINRSFYGGAMGYFDSNGQMDTCISLRTGLVKDKKLYIQAGGGVVFDSDSKKEFQETINKANALIVAAKDSYKYS